MVKSNLAKLMKEKKLTYRRLSELSGIAGETIEVAPLFGQETAVP